MKPVIICGSVAYDTIMVFDGHFREHILPDQIHILNVSFLVPRMRREFGGCAGNIAYNLKMLGGTPITVATVGSDATPYFDRFQQLGIETRWIKEMPGMFTAQCFITTDHDNNQITAFHPGAMAFSAQNDLSQAPGCWAIVAPDSLEGMMTHIDRLAARRMPFIFDPGQALPLFSADALLQVIAQADMLTLNDYEACLVEQKTGRSLTSLVRSDSSIVLTRGAEGSEIITASGVLAIPSVLAERDLDPTGCGDAYRGGLLYGLSCGFDLPTAARLASLMGSIKVAHQGGQNHIVDAEQIAESFFKIFGYRYN